MDEVGTCGAESWDFESVKFPVEKSTVSNPEGRETSLGKGD